MSGRTFTVNRQTHTVELDSVAREVTALPLNGSEPIRLVRFDPPRMVLEQGGRRVTAFVARQGTHTWVHVGGKTFVLEPIQLTRGRERNAAHADDETGSVLAPMPGQVRAVLVKTGDAVTEGQPLLLLEAMKMELRIPAPLTGRVTQLHVAEGDTVEREQLLARVERAADKQEPQ